MSSFVPENVMHGVWCLECFVAPFRFEARGAARHPLPEAAPVLHNVRFRAQMGRALTHAKEAMQNDVISRGSPEQGEHPSQWEARLWHSM